MTESRMTLSAGAAALLALDTQPWLSCDDCFERVDVVVDRFVSGASAIPADFRAHLSGCPACREEAGVRIALVAEEDGLAPERALSAFGHALVRAYPPASSWVAQDQART